jgi:hypothetical protein
MSGILNTVGGGLLEVGRAIYPYVLTAIGTYLGGPGVGGAIGGAFGGAFGGLAKSGTAQGMIGGGISGYFAGATWTDVLKNAAMSEAKSLALNSILSAVFGKGTGSGSVSFAGMDDGGILSSLSGGMASIAPQSSSMRFPVVSARNGLDYVPYDNMPALLHEGERVQTKQEAAAGRGGIGPVYLTVNINGANKSSDQIVDEIYEPLMLKIERKLARAN